MKTSLSRCEILQKKMMEMEVMGAWDLGLKPHGCGACGPSQRVTEVS